MFAVVHAKRTGAAFQMHADARTRA